MRTTRQVRNRILRDMGCFPRTSYHYDVRHGDRIAVRIVREQPPEDVRLAGVVLDVAEHGWYRSLRVAESGTGRQFRVTLFRAGPEDWGCVECRVTWRGAGLRRREVAS